MNLHKPFVYFPNLLTDRQCDDIIKLGTTKLQSATTVDGRDKTNKEKSIAVSDMTNEEIEKKGLTDKAYMRDSEIAWLSDNWIYNLINPRIQEANKHAGWNWDYEYIEQIQFTKYGLNQFYNWHADGNSDHYSVYKNKPNPQMNGKVRKISVTINLVDGSEYEGGNLNFDFGPQGGENRFKVINEIRPKGSMVVFPSFFYHQVTPVTKGTRYSLVMWCCGKPWR